MTLIKSITIGCLISIALAFLNELSAQVVQTINTTEVTTRTAGPGTSFDTPDVGPIVETTSEFGNPIAGSLGNNLGLGLLRRLRTTVSLINGYDDGANSSSTLGGSSSGSFYTNLHADLSYSLGSPRTRLNLAGGGGLTYFYDRTEGSPVDKTGYLAASFMHKFTKRLTLTVDALGSYQSQPDFSTDLTANQNLGSFFRLTDTNAVSFLWGPRFSTVTTYTLDMLDYESAVGSLEDRFEHTFGGEARFLLFPSTTVNGDYRFGIVDYQNAPLDSITHYLLAGFDHRFTPHLFTTFRAGLEIRSSDNNGDGLTPHFENTVSYDFGRRISVSWSNSYSTEESNSPGGTSGTTFRTGIITQLRLTRRISASLALNYIMGGTDDTFDVAPSVSMRVTSYLSVNAGYHFTNLDSDSALRSYSRNVLFVGVNFTF